MNDAAFRGLIWNLVVGISQGRFYSIDHESVVVAAKRVQSLLAEFPDGLCTIMVLKDDPELHISPGRPDVEPFQVLRFSDLPASAEARIR